MLAGVKLEVFVPSVETPDEGRIGSFSYSVILDLDGIKLPLESVSFDLLLLTRIDDLLQLEECFRSKTYVLSLVTEKVCEHIKS